MSFNQSNLWVAAVFAWIVLTSIDPTHADQFIPLGDLPGGIFSSSATSVNASGTVIVGSSSSNSPVAQAGAFIWTETSGMEGIGDGAGAEAISNDGLTAVGIVSDGTLITPFVWTEMSGLTSLGLPAGEMPNGASVALGVSGDGVVVVGSTQFGGTTQAFRWTSDGGFVGLASDLPGGGSPSLATGISDDGKVIVGGFTDGQRRAFRWTAESGGIDLGGLPGGVGDSLATAVSADGDWIVGTASSAVSTVEAFLWSEATGMIGIGLPSLAETTPFAVTNSGRAVVGRSDVVGVSTTAFVWTEGRGLESLQTVLSSRFGLAVPLAGWTLTTANDISLDGCFIVGSGINPDGNQEAWLVRLDRPIFAVPESATLSLLFLGAAICGSRRGRGLRS